MYSRYALLQNTMKFVQSVLDEKRMNVGMGDDLLYRIVFNLNNIIEAKGLITRTEMMASGIVLERHQYAPFAFDGVLVYRTGCENPKDDGHFYDRESIEFLSNMMGVK